MDSPSGRCATFTFLPWPHCVCTGKQRASAYALHAAQPQRSALIALTVDGLNTLHFDVEAAALALSPAAGAISGRPSKALS